MLTREQFQSLYEQGPDAVYTLIMALHTTVAAQQEQIATLTQRVAHLEAQLKTDSHNSSKPPSSDPPTHKPVSLRKPSGRKPGGQAGHPGRTLTLSDTPAVLVTHTPACCDACGGDLSAVPPLRTQRRQVWELPPLTLVVTEHRGEDKACAGCGHVTHARFPADVTQPVQYGPGLQALGTYLLASQLLPVHRTAELLTDVFGASVCPATLLAFAQRAAQTLQPAWRQIARAVQHAPVGHFDESGLRVNGKLHWLHVASTALLTHYSVHPKRGQAGLNAAGILPDFLGTAVHDGWASYFGYGCRHALCNVHHLRELQGVYEAAPHQQGWAAAMQTLLRDGLRAVQTAQEQGEPCLPDTTLAAVSAHYEALVAQGYAAHPPPAPQPHKKGKPKQSKARNLLDRLSKYQAQTLRFLYDFAVPFDNNQAERDVRMVKVQQNVSGGFRTQAGAETFCCLRSYLSTLRKQGRQVLSALQQVFVGNVPSPLPLPE